MHLDNAYNWIKRVSGKTYRLSAFLFVFFVTSLSTSFAYNVPQSESNNRSDNAYALVLKNALSISSLPMINEVSKLYKARKHNLIWSDGKVYNSKAHELLSVIKNARKVGLNPNDYDIDVIQYFLETTIDDSNIISKSDITFTHAYIKIASHIENENSLDLSDEFNLLKDNSFLSASIQNTSKNIRPDEKHSKPAAEPVIPQDYYSRLFDALQRYKNLSDNVDPIILDRRSFTIGDESPEIVKAKHRLNTLGDYLNNDLDNPFFDETLALAVTRFQSRHGLDTDGLLGKRTVREINRSFRDRAIQLEVNLERAKQLSEFGNDRYILVNVPEYKLYVIENSKAIYETRVVVGKRKHKTPVLTSEISEFVLNPYWNVPTSITKNEIIPKQQEDPHYLTKNNMKVISRVNNQNVFIDPYIVDWFNADPVNANFRIRQDPGVKNALGRVKFIFPNNYRVYLHDTPSRKLFSRNTRAFSHGCVRVENPLEFAQVLIRNSQTTTAEELEYFASRKKTKTIKLDRPIPIHITYMTAWTDENGEINFRPDIYKRDGHIAKYLYNTVP